LERIEPWGPRRDDYRAARIIEAIHAAGGAHVSFREILAMFDFDLKEPHSEEQDAEVLETIATSKIVNSK